MISTHTQRKRRDCKGWDESRDEIRETYGKMGAMSVADIPAYEKVDHYDQVCSTYDTFVFYLLHV
jgi:hypothetical protein